jgi:polyisoprenoid-binding protein YceI
MTWELDTAHAEVGFSAKHMMVTTVRGRFTNVAAEVHIDEQHPEQSHVNATIQAASLETGDAQRDAHLKSPDFFDVETYPTITFRSTRVSRRKDGEFELTGDLTVRDVTREVTLRGEFAGPVANPWGKRVVGFELDGELNREDFGLTWNVALEAGGVLVSKKIKLHIAVEVAEAVAIAA